MEIIWVMSAVGGCGATTAAAGIAAGLGKRGRRVLLSEWNAIGSLEVYLGCMDQPFSSLGDVLSGRVSLKEAAFPPEGAAFDLLPCGIPEEAATPEQVSSLISLGKEAEYDFLVLDVPPLEGLLPLLVEVSDRILPVATQTAVSRRALSYWGMRLAALGGGNIRFLLNGFSQETPPALSEWIDEVRLPLAGAIPASAELARLAEAGALGAKLPKSGNAAIAFSNIAGRLCGEQIPLFFGFRGVNRKKLIR